MTMRRLFLSTMLAFVPAIACMPALAAAPASQSSYVQHNFVANKSGFNADAIDEKMINAWGIATRPAGAGGHFWVVAKDTSFEYVGDVQDSPDPGLRSLHQDKLTHVTLPLAAKESFSTGVVFLDSKKDFVITQKIEGAEPITASSKFIFANDAGQITAWTERKKADGSFDRPVDAIVVIDNSAAGAQYFGLAVNSDYSRLYAANFGQAPGIEVFDGQFKPANIVFDQPFDDNKNGKVDPGEYAPFNIQSLKTPQNENHIFVAYAKTQACPQEEISKGTCKAGELFIGEEDTSSPGHGRIAEFTEAGKLIAVWKDGGHLSAPWGMAFAPEGFGHLSKTLLVGNFGDGTIAAYDPKTRGFVDVMRGADSKPVKVDKIWGIVFGNGQSLGDKNALYFAAGPNDEKDGLFGSLRLASEAQTAKRGKAH